MKCDRKFKNLPQTTTASLVVTTEMPQGIISRHKNGYGWGEVGGGEGEGAQNHKLII